MIDDTEEWREKKVILPQGAQDLNSFNAFLISVLIGLCQSQWIVQMYTG